MMLTFDDLVITHDGQQYILTRTGISKTGKTKGEKTSRTLGYYSSISQLLGGVVKYGMGKKGVDSVKHIKQMIDDAISKVKELEKES